MKTIKNMFKEYKGLLLFAITVLVMMQLAAINVEKINEQEENQSYTTTVEKR